MASPSRPNACALLTKALHANSALTVTQAFALSRLLESYIYTWSKTQTATDAYVRKTLQLESSFCLNAQFLVQQYELHELITLSNEKLAEQSPAEDAYKRYRLLMSRRDALRESMHQKANATTTHLEEETNVGPNGQKASFSTPTRPVRKLAGLRCSRCYSTSVALEQKQTRGADESMTVFCECNQCHKRWRM